MAARLLCVVGSYLASAVARATDSEAVAYAFEGAAKSIVGAGDFQRRKAPPEIVQRIARRQIKHIEESCEKWLQADLGARWRESTDAASILPALEHVLPACLPGSGDFAADDLLPGRIVTAALARAAALDPKDRTFAPGGAGYDVLRCLLVNSVAALEHDVEFRELLELVSLRELLRRSRAHDKKLLAIEAANERRHHELLEVVVRDKGGDPKPLDERALQTNAIRPAYSGGIPTAEHPTSEAGERPVLVRETSKIIRSGQFEADAEGPSTGSFLRYNIRANGILLKFSQVLDLWFDADFVDFQISLFRETGYHGYTCEMPAISHGSINRKFEIVIHSLPKTSGEPDRATYADYFDTRSAPDGIVSFANLGGDALLIVPSPFRRNADYSGMAEFFRDAPINQQRGLWRELGRHARLRLCDRPIWLSVAGGGIRWLHFRIDSIPKYYRYHSFTVE